MESIALKFLEANLLFAGLYLLYRFLLKRSKDFGFKRYFLLLSLILACTVPFVEFDIIKTSEKISLPPNWESLLTPTMESSTQAIEQRTSPLQYVGTILLLGAAAAFMLTLYRLLSALRMVKELINQSTYDVSNGVYICRKRGILLNFFQRIFISKDFMTEQRLDILLQHEKLHQKMWHSVDLFLFELLSAVFWFNPLFWKAKADVPQNHEHQVDAGLLQKVDVNDYQRLIINQLFTNQNLSMANYFSKTNTLKRIKMMKSTKFNSKRNLFIVSALSAFLVFVASCEMQHDELMKEKDQQQAIEINGEKKVIEVPSDYNPSPDEIFTIVEEQAQPVEGIEHFYNHIAKELEGNYPKQAQDLGIEGVVYVQFVIEKDGSLSNVQAVKGIGAGCDELAVQAVKSYNEWVPGYQRGRAVRSQRVVPIRFDLTKE